MHISVYCTFPDDAQARRISRVVVEEKLAACANIIGAGHSIYPWQGRIEESAEVFVLFKTRDALFEDLAARIKSLHSYETPCIVALPLTALDAAYAAWIEDSTKR